MNTWDAQEAYETLSSEPRRRREGYYERFFVGEGLDIGSGKRTVVPNAKPWDLANGDGDATVMTGLADQSFDFIYASHVLEHLENPHIAMGNWWRLVKPGGYLIVAVPDEELYEQGVWPSRFNSDHRHSYTAHKDHRPPHGVNLMDLILPLQHHKLWSLRVCDEGYDYSQQGIDQGGTERQVEAIIQKVKPLTWLDNIAVRFQCQCGCVNVQSLGMTRHHLLMNRCLDCGQVTTVNMPVIFDQLGVSLIPKTN